MSITVRNETAMKYGMRKPSWKKSLSARTKGRATRAVKRALIPGSGKKGMGWLHPKRKLYNAIFQSDVVEEEVAEKLADLFHSGRTFYYTGGKVGKEAQEPPHFIRYKEVEWKDLEKINV